MDRQFVPYQPHGPESYSFRNQVPSPITSGYDQPWKCTFCGSIHPTELARDRHMADSCSLSPKSTRDDTVFPQGRGMIPPMVKAHTIQVPTDPYNYHQQTQPEPQGYGYQNQQNRPLFENQPRAYNVRHNYPYGTQGPQRYPPDLSTPYHQGVNKGRALPDLPISDPRGVKMQTPYVEQPPSPGTMNPLRRPLEAQLPISPTHRPAMNRALTSTQEDTMGPSLTKVQSPLNLTSEATKVILVWSKDRPTMEVELTYFDNAQEPVQLLWSNDQSVYQGNCTLNIGQHHGSLLFPTNAEMLPVYPFEVSRKGMGIVMIKLILNTPPSVAMVTGGGIEKNANGHNSEVQQRDKKIEDMKREIEELTDDNNNIKSEKQKCKQYMIKLDEQLINVMLELSNIQIFGREDETRLFEENEKLKNQLQTIHATSRHNVEMEGNVSSDVLNENIRVLEGNILELKERESAMNATLNKSMNENSSLLQNMENIQNEKIRLEIQIQDLEESNSEYSNLNEELNNKITDQQQQQQIGGDQNGMEELKTNILELETTNKQLKDEIVNKDLEFGKSQETFEQTKRKYLFQIKEKEETITRTTNNLEFIQTNFRTEKAEILENHKLELELTTKNFEQKEIDLNNELVSVKEGLACLQQQSVDSELKDKQIMDLTTQQTHLCQQIGTLELTNSEIRQESANNPTIHKLTAELGLARDEITKTTNNCKELETNKIETEKQLNKQISELTHQILQLENDANANLTTIKEQHKQIHEYQQQQQQIETEELNIRNTSDTQIYDLKMQKVTLEASKQTYEAQVNIQFKEFNDEINQLKSDYEDLDNTRKHLESQLEEHTLNDKSIALENQIDVLKGQIGELSEDKETDKHRIGELENTVTGLREHLKITEGNLAKSETEIEKLQKVKTENESKSQGELQELMSDNDILKKELTSERESSKISKQLIGKLNDELEKLEGEKVKVEELQILLRQAEKGRNDTERRLEELTREIADRDSQIQKFNQDIAILQGKGQVSRSPSTPAMPQNPKLQNKNSKDTKQKHSDTSVATQSATNIELTPEIVPIPNKTGKSPAKITFKGSKINVVKLKALPSLETCVNKQVICTINKRPELGLLECLLDVDTKVGLRNVKAKYAGIKLYSPVGDSDGLFKGKRVFECDPKHAIFVPLEDVHVPVV
ncbi:hypothetical protein LOD99_6799 [Oopsacas minuta]|uniref:CAP-Gly domain-containing protein n=1 Tax=Oopsacas minuta TaxID=111878 RepID=A0AAV7JJI3_9METZ|nr:hypothetical protein LOD99_6799 [Oopsacas minuta]